MWGRAVNVVGAAVAILLPAGPAHASDAPNRYSLQGGCYALQDASGKTVAGGEQLRMQATTLGRYLLYRPDRTYLAAQPDGSLAPAPAPSPAADFAVDDAGSGSFTIAPQSAPDKKTTVRFAPAQGCAVFPEADLNATGTPAKNPLPFGKVGGIVEGHMHWMTFEYLGGNFHCGRPWHPYGIAYALPDCSSIEGPQGTAAPVQNFLNYGSPAAPHDTSGYPKMTAWSPGNLTYEGTYWRWVERAWLGGLRLMVMGINENRVLCELQQNRKHGCNEMDTVRRGLADMKELQRYVDAQAGGPGKGFFQIVTDPFEARRVINDGKMAVVLEIEVSEPFDCRGWDQPSCGQAQVDKQLNEMYDLGVRSSLLLNKFDNPLTGVRFDSGPVGVVINGGNRQSAGSFWSARTCTGPMRDNEIFTGFQPVSAALDTLLGTAGAQSGTLPSYPNPPHCNTRGLTALGKHVVKRMMDLHMIVNPDHMSQAAVDSTLDLLEARRYSGVISPHGWMDPGNWPRIWRLGGMAFPGHSTAEEYVKDWKKYRPKETPYAFGWGYGADLGGLAHQPDPSKQGQIEYPFKSYDRRVTFERQKTGERTFDYVKEGVSQYGLYADWFNDLERLGGKQMADDLWKGAEAYLEMWERANGVRAPGCARSDGEVKPHGFNRLRVGDDWVKLLQRAGQPQTRGRAWAWCVAGKRNRDAADVAELTSSGKVELVGSTARGRTARGVDVGHSAPVTGAQPIGDGVLLDRGGSNWVFAVRRGAVRAVAVASDGLATRPKRLRAAMRRLLAARTTQAKRVFEPGDAARSASASTLFAGTADPRLNAAFAFLCSAQLQAYGGAAN
ncbi:MAG TPA: hypothetical protein VE570_07370 [Thermoleophilaceae bacterium]|nr:hypothetical protein [Thermoleophilaceae bacterium]